MGIHQPLFAEYRDHARRWTDREKRYALAAQTIVTNAAGTSAAALILNLSNRGCRIATELSVQRGERLYFLLEPFGFVAGEVRWISGNEMGLKIVARDFFYSEYEFAFAP